MTDPRLREEINRHTSSEAETSGILRSLERFGGDESIDRYEVTPEGSRRLRRSTQASWVVRAVRGSAPKK